MPVLSDWKVFLPLVLVMFAMVVFRYFLVAGIFFWYFYLRPNAYRVQFKITLAPYQQGQFRREMYWSVLSSVIFAFFGAVGAVMWQLGYTQVYLTWQGGLWAWAWFGGSILLAMLLHETYYYWLHRLMHHPRLFRYIHKVHHDSRVASPWTAFSFHPYEAILEAIALPVIICLVPMHPYAIVTHLSIMTISSVVNHLDIEIYPVWLMRHWLGQWLIGATHHSLHHTEYKTNYGLYFTFWDRLMDTESQTYHHKIQEFGEKVA